MIKAQFIREKRDHTPILSRRAEPASLIFIAVSTSLSKLGTVEAKKASKIGSPKLPLPGH